MERSTITGIISTLFFLSSATFAATNNAKDNDKNMLSDEIAGCYVAHRNANTDFFKAGEAEVYKKIIAQLSGEDNVHRIISIAERKQKGLGFNGGGSVNTDPKRYASKYCTNIEEKLLSLMTD